MQNQSVFLGKLLTQERRQRLQQNHSLYRETTIGTSRVARPSSSSAQKSQEEQQEVEQEGYVRQTARLYKIQNLKWTPFFQQGENRKVEFQISCINQQTFKIKVLELKENFANL